MRFFLRGRPRPETNPSPELDPLRATAATPSQLSGRGPLDSPANRFTPSAQTVCVSIMLAVGAAAIAFGQTSSGQAVLREVGLSAPPTSFTQLYFLRPGSLPHRVPIHTATQTVAFAIVNSGPTGKTYRWSAGQVGHRPAGGGLVALRPGQAATISQDVGVQCDRPRIELSAAVSQPSESIDFWEECSLGVSGATRSHARLPRRGGSKEVSSCLRVRSPRKRCEK